MGRGNGATARLPMTARVLRADAHSDLVIDLLASFADPTQWRGAPSTWEDLVTAVDMFQRLLAKDLFPASLPGPQQAWRPFEVGGLDEDIDPDYRHALRQILDERLDQSVGPQAAAICDEAQEGVAAALDAEWAQLFNEPADRVQAFREAIVEMCLAHAAGVAIKGREGAGLGPLIALFRMGVWPLGLLSNGLLAVYCMRRRE